ncbi:MAG: hypothetical protein M1826_005102 [Phylliscum demangeonii]|nr:MAG: hypothetical protein M1826_005102 [Phylliscum demangeonii]
MSSFSFPLFLLHLSLFVSLISAFKICPLDRPAYVCCKHEEREVTDFRGNKKTIEIICDTQTRAPLCSTEYQTYCCATVRSYRDLGLQLEGQDCQVPPLPGRTTTRGAIHPAPAQQQAPASITKRILASANPWSTTGRRHPPHHQPQTQTQTQTQTETPTPTPVLEAMSYSNGGGGGMMRFWRHLPLLRPRVRAEMANDVRRAAMGIGLVRGMGPRARLPLWMSDGVPRFLPAAP